MNYAGNTNYVISAKKPQVVLFFSEREIKIQNAIKSSAKKEDDGSVVYEVKAVEDETKNS